MVATIISTLCLQHWSQLFDLLCKLPSLNPTNATPNPVVSPRLSHKTLLNVSVEPPLWFRSSLPAQMARTFLWSAFAHSGQSQPSSTSLLPFDTFRLQHYPFLPFFFPLIVLSLLPLLGKTFLKIFSRLTPSPLSFTSLLRYFILEEEFPNWLF